MPLVALRRLCTTEVFISTKFCRCCPHFAAPLGATFSERSLGKSVYYYPYPSSRAATMLRGRLVTCGRLLIGLLASLTNASTVCGFPPLWGSPSWLQPTFFR